MLSNNHTPNNPQGTSHPILSAAALFEDYFSIDWVIGLTEEKASRVLHVLEEEVKLGRLSKKGHDLYCVTDADQKEKWLECLENKDKLAWHQKIVDFLIKELPEDDQKVRIVADHMLHLANDIDGCRWLIKSGDEHAARFRLAKAIQYYSKALDDLEDKKGDESDVIYVDAAIKYAMSFTGRENSDRVVSVLQHALNRPIVSRDNTYYALLKIHQAKIKWLCARYEDALTDFDEGWAIAKEMENPKLLHTVNTFIPYFFYFQGRFQEAVEMYEKAVPKVEKTPTGTFSQMAALTAGVCYVHIGQITQGIGTIDAIRASFIKANDPHYVAFADNGFGIAMLNTHRLDNAIRYFKDSLENSERSDNYIARYTALIGTAFAYYLKEDINQSVTYLRQFLKCRKEFESFVHLASYILKIAWAMKEGNYPKVKGLSFDKEYQRILHSGNVLSKGVALRFKAMLQVREGVSKDDTLASLKESLATLKESGHRIEYAMTQLDLARFYLLAFENKEEAKKMAIEASKILVPVDESLIPDDLKSLIQDMRTHQNPFEGLLELSQKMVTTRNEKELVQKIISTANRFTGAERGAIFLLEGVGDRSGGLYLRASKNITEAQTLQPDFSESMKLAREVARSGKGRILETSADKNEMARPSRTIRSRICVPMILRNQVMGVLYNDNRLLNSVFKKSDLKVLSYFATQAILALDNAMAYEHIERLNRRLKDEKLFYEEQHMQQGGSGMIVGESAAIKYLVSQLHQVAKSDSTVLILGETGVGKDLVAQTIHRLSHRANGPYISVQCSALPESLMSSELFGHEKGAYTGAIKKRVGRFELADKGTLFLDEIGTLPMETQIRLLRVIQSKNFERIGGGEAVKSDFRLVTATNVNLEQEVKEGRFRADLFYRINVFPVRVPPLRERIEDIPLLADHFLEKYAEKKEKPFKFFKINSEDMHRLMSYEWKGNVRELENIIERGVILSTGSRFELPELMFPQDEYAIRKDGISLVENERRHILRALQKTGWKVHGPKGAARILDINPSTLVSRIKKHGIHRPDAFKKGKNRR